MNIPMIDVHTHMLPGIDDGSKDVPESLAMLESQWQQGVEIAFLTPHFYADEQDPVTFLKHRYHAWRQLESALHPQLPQLRLGAEVQYFEGICEVEEIRHLRIVGTNLLLLEMPFCHWSDRMLSDVTELGLRYGLQIVLAHIERYMAKQSPNLWRSLCAEGIWLQSNVSFFANKKTKKQALAMLESGQIQLLGSDCHNMNHRQPNWAQLPPRAREAYGQTAAYRAIRQMDSDGIHLEML